MSEMVKRVAMVLDRYAFIVPPPVDDPGGYWGVLPKDQAERTMRQELARDRARRIIAAMREPTEAMIAAATYNLSIPGKSFGHRFRAPTEPSFADQYQAAIDEALK